MKRICVRVTGKVQDVWFRDNTQKQATALGINGYVKNESDGSVFIDAEGPEDKLNPFLDWVAIGPELARVDSLTIEEPEEMIGYKQFEIRS